MSARARKVGDRWFIDGRSDTLSVVAYAVGMSRATYARLAAVYRAAKADPERFGHLMALMDREGVNAGYRQMQAIQAETGSRA